MTGTNPARDSTMKVSSNVATNNRSRETFYVPRFSVIRASLLIRSTLRSVLALAAVNSV
jgi:hypothetical protein